MEQETLNKLMNSCNELMEKSNIGDEKCCPVDIVENVLGREGVNMDVSVSELFSCISSWGDIRKSQVLKVDDKYLCFLWDEPETEMQKGPHICRMVFQIEPKKATTITYERVTFDGE